MTVVTIALGIAALFTEGHIGSGVREDRSNRWVIAALGLLGVLDAYLPAYTDRIDFLTFGGDAVRWLGVLLYTAGGVLRLAPVFVLGRRFSGLVAIQPGHRLVTSGLYGSFATRAISVSLSSRSAGAWRSAPGSGVVIAVLMLFVLLARIRAEERLLSETFGAEYDAYRARTWRLVALRLLSGLATRRLPRRRASHKPPSASRPLDKHCHDPLRPDDRDDQRRDQGRARPQTRFRRGQRTAGVDEGPGRLRQSCRQAGGEDPLRGARQSAPGLRLRHGGERPGRGDRQEPHLAHRSARRDDQLPARDPDVRDLDRARARGADRRRRHL